MALFCQMSQLLVRAAVAAGRPVPQIAPCDQRASHGVALNVPVHDGFIEVASPVCVFDAFVAVEQYGARHTPKPVSV